MSRKQVFDVIVRKQFVKVYQVKAFDLRSACEEAERIAKGDESLDSGEVEPMYETEAF